MILKNRDLKLTLTGDDVHLLQSELISLGYAIVASETQAASFGAGTQSAVQAFQKDHNLPITGVVDAATQKALDAAVSKITYAVRGTVTSPDRAGLAGLRVEFVDKNVGGDVTLAETTTDGGGGYQVTFAATSLLQRKKASPDLQARVYAAKTLLASSAIRYGASRSETLDVVLPAGASALPSEFETLTAALGSQYTGKLGDLKENAAQQDITYLANKTGWDARAVAYASLADQLARSQLDANGNPKLDPAFYYALLRGGLPTTADALYQVDAQTVSTIWTNAVAAGVVPQSLTSATPAALQTFQGLSAAAMLDAPAQTGASTMRQMLAPVLTDAAKVTQFATLLAQHRADADMTAFWSAVAGAFGADTAKRLQADGQLGYLTLNNATLIGKVRASIPTLSTPLDLVAAGYYRASAWTTLLGTSIPSPDSVPGASPAEKLTNYTNALAAQVRRSFPTAVVSDMVRTGDFPLSSAVSATPTLSAAVQSFLTTYQATFDIGQESVDRFVARNNLGASVSADVRSEVRRLQRVRQITPSDQAMTALLRAGVDSSYQIARQPQAAFVEAFAGSMGSAEDAQFVHARAQQIYASTLNVALSYLAQRRATSVGSGPNGAFLAGAPAPTTAAAPPPAGTTPAAPPAAAAAPGTGAPASPGAAATSTPPSPDTYVTQTLEGLFGSMDFCACDECRSMLSPAAYLVDLLAFVDSGSAVNPFTALNTRRPDIANLPLTCENTNTALPYIDVVNETLEYWVASKTPGQPPYTGYAGHDTGDIASADLIATPQYVSTTAYGALQAALYPQPLPFSRSLELLRRLFAGFGVPLPRAMDALLVGSFASVTAPPTYTLRDVLLEEIAVSPAEDAILSAAVQPSLATLYGQPAAPDAAIVQNTLVWVAKLIQSLGIAYTDLVAMLETRFVNPSVSLASGLEALPISFAAFVQLSNGTLTPAQFNALLPATFDASPYGGNVATWAANHYAQIAQLILISNPSDPSDLCTLAELQLRYPNPDPTTSYLGAPDYVRIALFVRLWKKLGWTTDQTDRAIAALRQTPAPAAAGAPAPNPFDASLLPRLGVVARVIGLLALDVDADLPGLLACFAPIDSNGPSSLYAEMFLQPSLMGADPAFALDVWGKMTGVTANLMDSVHLDALRSAFNLTGDELSLICSALGFRPPPTAPATPPAATPLVSTNPGGSQFDNISAVYRRAWLARKLGLSVRELLLLIQFTGVNPFCSGLDGAGPLDPTNPAIIHFVTFVQALQAAGITPAQALYWMWNQDLSGTSTPADADIAQLARTLRADLMQVDSDYAVVDDPTFQITRARMAVVYGQDATNFFFSLVGGTFSATTASPVSYSNPAGALAATILQASVDPSRPTGGPRLSYDDFAKTLTFTGVLDAPAIAALTAAAGALPTPDPALVAALGTVAPSPAGTTPAATTLSTSPPGTLAAVTQDALNSFFAQYPDLLSVYQSYYALYSVSRDPVSMAAANQSLLGNLLADLKAQRKQEKALSDIAAASGFDPSFAQALLADATVMHSSPTTPPATSALPAVVDVTGIAQPALQVLGVPQTALSLAGVGDPGLAVQYYWSATATGAAAPPVDVALPSMPPPPQIPTPGQPFSCVWTGYVEAASNGLCKLIVQTDPGATVTVTLSWQGQPVTMAAAPTGAGTWTTQGVIGPLIAGTLYEIALTVNGLTSTLSVEWQRAGGAVEVIPPQYLYSSTLVSRLRSVYVRYLKAASLATSLKLRANEIAYFAQNEQVATTAPAGTTSAGWLDAMTVSGSPAPSSFADLLGVLRTLLEFARIKAALSPGDQRLLAILRDPTATLPTTATQGVAPTTALVALTGWDTPSVTALITHWWSIPTGQDAIGQLAEFDSFRRVYDAYAVAKTIGISCATLLSVTTNNPGSSSSTTDQMESSLRARYAPADWRTVIKPIHDQMRSLQRDALVAYVLQAMVLNPPVYADGTTPWPITSPDQLFEYFLMDVQMDPCMETSRVRHALSGVQLFVDRCLMNLEVGIPSTAVDATKWTWMKRYRVWEANREVFLWPENWLDPELRDDQTSIFQSALSTLLQGDITEDSGATALLQYLNDLEVIAKLEPCGLCYDEGPPPGATAAAAGVFPNGSVPPVAHVIARTSGAQRQYYYRRRMGVAWTPWEKIPVDIEDNPVLPVVWQGRLLLFWCRIISSPPQSPKGPDLSSLSSTPSSVEVLNGVAGSMAGQATPSYSATLCFSEYHNGKWQPTKTSDPLHPSPFANSGAAAPLDRSSPRFGGSTGLLLQQSSEPLGPTNGTVLGIALTSGWLPYGQLSQASWVLYNTHTGPVAQPLTALASPPDAFISLDSAPGPRYALSAYYDGYARSVMTTDPSLLFPAGLGTPPAPAGTTQPWQPLAQPFVAPFLYWDTRYAFYVTSTASPIPVPKYGGYVLPANAAAYATRVPPLAVASSKAAPAVQPILGPGDPANVGTASGTNVRFVLQDPSNVRVANVAIGPLGSSFASPGIASGSAGAARVTTGSAR